MKPVTVYRLSRIQAEGWNAARSVSGDDLADFDTAKIEALNPYPADPERARWLTGFKSAL